jgi:outer membrane protein assembly factor BamB
MRVFVVVALVACVGCKKKPRAAPGPAVAWRAAIDKDTYDAVAVANQTLVVAGQAGITALRDGTSIWTRALEAEPSAWLVPLGSDRVLAGDDKGTVYAITIADGSVAWKAKTPTSDGEDSPWIKDAAAAADRIVLLDAYMRFLVLDAAACAAGGEGCMMVSGELANGAMGEEIALAPDGMRVVSEFSWVALYSASGERITSFIADDLLGGVAVTSSGVFVAHEKGVARIDAARCKIEGSKFRLGEREDRDEAPAGCLERIHVGPTKTYAPVSSGGAVAWVTEDDELRGRGTKSWQIDMATLHLASQPVLDGKTVYVACWVEPKGDDMFVTFADLCAVSLDTGAVQWRSPLGLRRAGMLSSPWITVGGGMIYVVLADQVAALHVR